MGLKRTHDLEIYLNENRYDNPKECFKFIAAKADAFVKTLAEPKVLDVGCATGEFLYYYSKLYPQARCTGLDVMPKLIERARMVVPGSNFIIGDIYTGKGLPREKFDIVFCIGVGSIFDNQERWLDNLIRLMSPGGRIYIFGIFNPEDVDIRVLVRNSAKGGNWEPGWNNFSCRTISQYLKKRGLYFNFIKWDIPIDIPKNELDPIRSYTIKLENGARLVVTGAQLILNFFVLEMRAS
jgi:SAM-dependent methyltransferase